MSETFNVEEYVRTNPHVWAKFKEYAEQALASGRKYFSARTIIERIRWDTNIAEKGAETFKIGDHSSPYLARKLMAEDPRFKGFFRTKISNAELSQV